MIACNQCGDQFEDSSEMHYDPHYPPVIYGLTDKTTPQVCESCYYEWIENQKEVFDWETEL